jgi:hypothetical protein
VFEFCVKNTFFLNLAKLIKKWDLWKLVKKNLFLVKLCFVLYSVIDIIQNAMVFVKDGFFNVVLKTFAVFVYFLVEVTVNTKFGALFAANNFNTFGGTAKLVVFVVILHFHQEVQKNGKRFVPNGNMYVFNTALNKLFFMKTLVF